jgi:ornithine cyclodeaminase/alanine dehydrogenase-like protein (mu-crystallin family)
MKIPTQAPILTGSVTVLDSSFIRSSIPMARAIELMESAFRLLSGKEAHVPRRVVMSTPDERMSVFFKPAFLDQYSRMSIKILTQIHAGFQPGNPTIKGLVLLVDTQTGHTLSISDGTAVTALRTGAASGIATSYLAGPDASSVAVFGCGAQGRTQLEAILAVRPVRLIFLYDQSDEQANRMADGLGLAPGIRCVVNPGLAALKEVEIICTATPSGTPLFGLEHLRSGVHINAVGSYRPDMNEIDPAILGAGRIYLDDAQACLTESGDLLRAMDLGVIEPADVMGEIGDLIAGSIRGRQNPQEITIFKSVGNAIQDFFITNEAYERSALMKGTQHITLAT